MTSSTDSASILVVDDLPEKLLVYEAILSSLCENLVLVNSGAQALKQVLHRQFAVILLDVNMPDMDGFETARLIRGHRRSSSTPIIFLTAFADEVRTAEGYATGAVDYLPTPVVPEILRAKVRVFVELFKMRQQMAQRAEERARHAASEDAIRRLTFLSDAGGVLGRSLDLQATARDLVQLPIPYLGDASLLSFASSVATTTEPLAARLDVAGNPQLVEVDTLPEFFQDVARLAFESGRRIERSLPDPEAEAIVAQCVAIPMQARGRTFAVLTIGRSQNHEEFSGTDLATAVALASRASTALDNALLHEDLLKADRQRIDFLSMLAHELRNPLAPICNAVQLQRMLAADDADLQWSSEVIERQVGQMVRLVDDLLDVSRITSGKIRLQRCVMDVLVAVRQALEASQPLIEERNHRLTLTLPEQAVWVEGDAARLTQVVTNLLNNSAKYTEDGGEIALVVQRDESHVVITVRDNGIGIPPDMLPSVFDLFTQVERTLDRSSGGLGIGLTLVDRLVRMHGGAVSATSDGFGRGSTFTVTLPTCCAPVTESEPVLSTGTETDSPLRPKILIVDDNADATDTLATLFRQAGHHVQVAYDGLSGVTIARAFQPEIVLLDIGLPGLDGYTVARQLREADDTRHSLLIAISGYGQAKDDQRSKQAGFDLHLVKPVEFQTLQSVLRSNRLTTAVSVER